MLERDPEGSVRALRARLRAGASIDENVLEQLVSVTLKTRDHRPWRPLVVRPAVERARAVQALLERSSELQPRQQLVEVLGAIYPRGANLDSWCATLLSWVEDHDVSATALEILEETLIDWPASSTRASRASVWSEAVSALIRVGRYDAAAGAIRSSLAKQLATDGGSQALVDGWVSIPKAHRDARQLTELVDLLYTAPDRDAAVGRLFLAVREDKALTTELVRRWRKLCGDASLGDDDPLFAAMRRTGQLNDWVHAAVASAHPSELERVIRAIHRPPNDPVWVELEQAAASTYGTAPRDRFVNLTRLAQGLPALEPVARQIVGPAMESTTFPDRGIHNTALALIDVQDRSPIWPFVAISAGDPGTYEDEVVDATVVAFFEHAPASEPEVVAARICAHALGRAAAWEPLDHARWLVRLILAPDPSATGLNEQLAYTLIHALGTRPDAIDRLADITHAFFELPRDHLALRVFAERLLPNAWNGPVPYEFFHAIDHTRLPREVLQHWQAAGRDRW
jgi:hypothetical protein